MRDPAYRRFDPVQCQVCGFPGPAASASTCPRCRTSYDGDVDKRQIAFTYAKNANEVLVAVADVLHDQIHTVAVVRRVSDDLYHVGGLRLPVQVDMFMGLALTDAAKKGDVVYVSYEDRAHRLLRPSEMGVGFFNIFLTTLVGR